MSSKNTDVAIFVLDERERVLAVIRELEKIEEISGIIVVSPNKSIVRSVSSNPRV